MSNNNIIDKPRSISDTDDFHGVGATSYLNPSANQPQMSVSNQEKKSIFGADNKPDYIPPSNNINTNQNRSRTHSQLSQQNQQQNSYQNQDQSNLFQNPLFNVNTTQQQPQQKNTLQTYPTNYNQQSQQNLNQNVQGRSNSGFDQLNISQNNKPSIKQSQQITLSQQNYLSPQQQQQPLRESIFGKPSIQPNEKRNYSYSQQDPRISSQLQQQQQINQQYYQQQQLQVPDQNQMRQSTVVKVDPKIKMSVGPNISNQTTQQLQTQGAPFFFNKRVVVTGASSGVGRAIAIWFLNSGCQVALVGRDLEALVQVGKQFPKQALVIRCDLAKDDQPYDMATTVVKEFGGIDILINAAGIMVEGDTKTTFPHDFDYLIDINLRSVYYLSFLFHHTLAENKGCIINFSGQYGSKPYAGLYALCMSKAGVETLTKHLALELAQHGVRVNCISPSLMDTNNLIYRKLDQGQISDIYDNASKFNPLKRLATVDDIGKAVIYLCSSGSSHITGQILKVDGGRTLTSSGWHEWKGSKQTELAMESEESTVGKFKNFFSSSTASFSTPEEKIEALLKTTTWSTSDMNAHLSVTQAYKNTEARFDPVDTGLNVQKAFNKVLGGDNSRMLNDF